MRERIWYEMTQSLFNVSYISKLIVRQRKMVMIMNFIIILFSTSGVMGFGVWKYYPVVACVIVSSVSVLKIALPAFLGDAMFLQKMDQVYNFYKDYANQLEKLWFDVMDGCVSEEECKILFFKIKENETGINSKTSEVLEKQFFLKRIERKAEEETKEFLHNIYKV